MKVIIFGATGTIGNHLVEQSLVKGHEVSAFSRNIYKQEEINHANLKKVEGDVLNPTDVQNAIIGQDVVIIVLGAGKSLKGTVRSIGTETIVEAMKKNGVQRLICLSTLGAGESKGNLSFFWKYIMFGWFLKQVRLDHELQEKYVKESELDWTIVRAAAFVDGEKTENYKHGFDSFDRSIRSKISRADVACFILKQLESSVYLFKSPGLSY